MYIPCPSCESQSQRYLFYRSGVRFVRCRACDLVYTDPVAPRGRGYFDLAALKDYDEVDRRIVTYDFVDAVQRVAADHERRHGRPPLRLLLLGRWHPDFATALGDRIEVELGSARGADETELVSDPLRETLGQSLDRYDIILFNEFFEGVHQPLHVLEGLARQMNPDTTVAVLFANMRSVPSRILRRQWKQFFDQKIAFYDEENLEKMMWRADFTRLSHQRLRTTFSLRYLARRLEVSAPAQEGLGRSALADVTFRVSTGRVMTLFAPTARAVAERLSIIVPVFNEERYVGDVLSALLAKELPLEKEIIVVESNSTDRSREIVRSFEGRPGVTVVYEDQPRGKGHAVRAGLEHATGSIILIQDADFEYDLDDYDALLEPIMQRRASFVLGSRSLGLDDWKVRRYPRSRLKGALMNVAHIAFAQTFNLLYQQNTTDINTMLKVFRRECIAGCELRGEGFEFDIELVCKIVRNGFQPLEVPVNYHGRGFEEGKKINFLFDAYPSYYQLFRWRFGRI